MYSVVHTVELATLINKQPPKTKIIHLSVHLAQYFSNSNIISTNLYYFHIQVFTTKLHGFEKLKLKHRPIRLHVLQFQSLTLILPRSRTGTVWFYTSTSNKRAARPKLYTKSLTRDVKRMYSRLTLVRISINL